MIHGSLDNCTATPGTYDCPQRFSLQYSFGSLSVGVNGEANNAEEVRELLWTFLLGVGYMPETVKDILGERG